MTSTTSQFIFRRTDRVGSMGAEEDDDFLASCFVETGDLDLLADLADNRLIILGRTGTGKTALIKQLARTKPERVIEVRPRDLALSYLANSTILRFFTAAGVNLDPFYSLLWRHVFTVEILTRHFSQHVSSDGQKFADWLRDFFPGQSKREKEMNQLVQYLEDWGKTFWQETEFRVKEITETVESDLNSALQGKIELGGSSLSAGMTEFDKLTSEEKSEIVARGQDVVSNAQVRDLHRVVELLDTVLEDRQKQYYLVVDGLDEDWVEDRLRYKLVMALILTAKDFINVGNAKAILALRRDLVDRVFRLTRDSGFQEEKYQSLYLPLAWTKSEILEILDRRVTHLVARRYTGKAVSYVDVLPESFNGLPIGDYIYSVAKKPREVIAFFNTCIHAAADQPTLSSRQLGIAEGEYSRFRLRALGDEWSGDYPLLLDYTRILSRRSPSFKVDSIGLPDIEDIALDCVAAHPNLKGLLHDAAKSLVNALMDTIEFRTTLIQVFYRVGLVGLEVSREDAASWADDLGQAVSREQIRGDTIVVVTPTYHRALGIMGDGASRGSR